MNQKDILKELLLIEAGEPDTFDKDPMGFILRKYASLNQTMVELMTRSYKDYVYGIYIVAPKPTTFKVVLHNNQYFFLTYLGPTYEATVEGKNYYLSDLGEKERCIVAISKILRNGSPIKTKGPAGAEKSAKDEEGNTGGNSGGGEETEPEVPAAETGEELAENAKLILRLLLEQEIEKDKNSSQEDDNTKKSNDTATKKKTKLPQTPIIQKGSLTPSSLGVGGKSYKSIEDMLRVVSESLNKITGKDEQQVSKTKEFLMSLCNDVEGSQKSVKKSEDGDIIGGTDNIIFSKLTIDALSGVNRQDLNTIGIEFGEILGAIYLAAGLIAINENGILFPSVSNNPVFDFSVSGISVSSKYKKGAASSLRAIIDENENEKNKVKLTEEAKKLLTVLSDSLKRSTSISYLYLAKKLNDPKINEAFSKLNEEFGIDVDPSKSDDDSIKSSINNAILKLREQENGDNIVKEKLNSFYRVIGRREIAEDKQPRWHQLPGGDKKDAKLSDITYYGLVTSPMSYFLTDLINSKKDGDTPYTRIKELIQNTKITQLRLNFSLREKSARFSSQSSKSENAQFQFFPKVTANQPEKGVMSFRME